VALALGENRDQHIGTGLWRLGPRRRVEQGLSSRVNSRPCVGCVVCCRVTPTPSLVPDFDVTVHIVLDDFGAAGRVYRETDEATAGRGDVIDDLLTGQFNHPLRVIAFNTTEGWSRDVSEDIAWELTRRVSADQKPLTAPTRAFVEYHIGEDALLHAEAGLL
jgi:hypothetical protein